MKIVPFGKLATSDLFIDAVYEGGHYGNTGDDPLSKLFRCGNQGGFRKVNEQKGDRRTVYVVIYSSLADPDWPDHLDVTTGRFTYYGDNKQPGASLHDTPRGGNKLLADVFTSLHISSPNRSLIPPFFVFTKASTYGGRAVQFRGLAVPGAIGVAPTDDLVAVWKSSEGQRFQNYRALFTILRTPFISRSWLEQLYMGNPLSAGIPKEWLEWVETGRYLPLLAQPTLTFRSVTEQLPTTDLEWEILGCIYDYFKENPRGFEFCAAAIAQMMEPNIVVDDITRPTADGGRDAIGRYRLGPLADPIHFDFALEAKCYCPGLNGESINTVGVREISRLISRLRHRQFGILVTTSALARQAYQEIREDNHPIIVLSGRDIVQLLFAKGLSSSTALLQWLLKQFPKT